MATREITSTILKADGSPWRGATVTFRPADDTYTLSPDVHFPLNVIPTTTDAGGELSVTLASGTSVYYVVTLPDDETFNIYVPEGAATTLELLRAAYDLTIPEPPANIEDLIEGIVAAAIPDSSTIDSTFAAGEYDLEVIPDTTVQKIEVRKNSSGSAVAARKRLNFIEGTNVTLTIADDGANNELDITIASSGGGGGAIDIKEANNTVVAGASALDFDGDDFNVTDGTGGRAVVALAGALGGSIELKEDNVQVIAAMTALDFEGDHFNVTNAGSGRGVITLASPGGGGGGGSGVTTIPGSLVFGEGAADSTSVVAIGPKGYLRIPFACTITGWTIITDVPSTAVLDVWKIAAGTTLPTASITGSAKPTITAADVINSTTLTGWTTAVAAGDLIGWEVESNNNAHSIDFQINFNRDVVNQYTDEDAQDAVGAILVDGTGINFTYTDATPSITAEPIFAGSGSAGTVAHSDHQHNLDYAALGHTHPSTEITDFTEAAQDAIAAMTVDTATIDVTYTDATPELKFDVITDSSVQKVDVRKNSAGTVHSRRRLNFIEGANVTLTVADDAGDNEVDVTIASTGGGGGGSLAVQEGGNPVVGVATALNFAAADFNITDETSGVAGVALAPLTSASLSDFTEAAQDAVGTILVDGTGINFTYSDATPAITAEPIFAGTGSAGTVAHSDHDHTAAGITDFAENVDDRVASLIDNTTSLAWTYNDVSGSLAGDVQFAGTGAAETAAHSDHIHTSGTISDFTEAAQDAVGAILVDGTGINFTYNDATPSITAEPVFGGNGAAGTVNRSDHTHVIALPSMIKFAMGTPGGGVIAAGTKGYIYLSSSMFPSGGTITGWVVLSDVTTTTVLDVWKDILANHPPTDADRIAGTEKPTISANDNASDVTLSTWTTAFSGGDVLGIEVESNTAAAYLELSILITRNVTVPASA